MSEHFAPALGDDRLRIDSAWIDTTYNSPRVRRVQILSTEADERGILAVIYVLLYDSGGQVPNTVLRDLASRFRYGDCFVPDTSGLTPPVQITEVLERDEPGDGHEDPVADL